MSTNSNNYNNNNNNNNEDDFPWPWFHAVQGIVKRPSPDKVSIPEPPVEVLPWLYLSPIYCVRDNIPRLEELGITHVLSTNRMAPRALEAMYWELKSVGIDQHYLAADDHLDYQLMEQHWDECRTFLEDSVPFLAAMDDNGNGNGNTNINHKVVVHCNAGMNRSGTIVAAAMMYFAKMDLLPVVCQLKAQRGQVLSNESFVKQLVEFAAQQGRLGPQPEGYPSIQSPQPLDEALSL
jgi:protein-tyrosine phosphatase